jgi:hypothetical protein
MSKEARWKINVRSAYTEEQHYHTDMVRSLQAGGVHDNYKNISRTTYTQTSIMLRK